MAYERRGLRPFDVMDRTQKLLGEKLRVQSPRIPDGHLPMEGSQGLEPHGVRGGAIAAPGGTLLLDADEYTTNTIGLYFGLNDGDWQEVTRTVGEEIDAIFGKRSDAPINLLVTVTNIRLRMSHVVMDIPLADWMNSDSWRFDLVAAGATPTRPRPLKMPQDGCLVTVQFVLGADLPERLRIQGRPWRKGSWLAKWAVKVAANRGSGLAPRPLNAEVRRMHGLGNHCTSFIDLRGERSGICMAADLGEVVTVYIDEELLRAASAQKANGEPTRPASNPLLGRIVMDTYRAIVFAVSADEELNSFDVDDDDHKRTFTYHLLGRVSEYARIPDAEALNVLRDQPNKFIALLEGSLDLLSLDMNLLELKEGKRS